MSTGARSPIRQSHNNYIGDSEFCIYSKSQYAIR
jgi:hypothetical protein